MIDVNLPRPPVLHARGAAGDGRAGRRPHRQRLLGRGPPRPLRRRRLQHDQVRASAGSREALRQEALHASIRVTIIEPGAVETELLGHNDELVQEAAKKFAATRSGKPLESEDIADAIVYAVAQPPHVSDQRGPGPADRPAQLRCPLTARARGTTAVRAAGGPCRPRTTWRTTTRSGGGRSPTRAASTSASRSRRSRAACRG